MGATKLITRITLIGQFDFHLKSRFLLFLVLTLLKLPLKRTLSKLSHIILIKIIIYTKLKKRNQLTQPSDAKFSESTSQKTCIGCCMKLVFKKLKLYRGSSLRKELSFFQFHFRRSPFTDQYAEVVSCPYCRQPFLIYIFCFIPQFSISSFYFMLI